MKNLIIPVILAGGFGTRIQHLLPDIPKPMASVAEKPFIEWIVRYLTHEGLSSILISTGYLGNVIEDYFQAHPLPNPKIACYREKMPLGTGGGFLQATELSHLTPDAWLVMNGDSLVFTPLSLLFAFLDDESIDGVIIGVKMDDASRYGSLSFDEENNLQAFAEKRAGSGIINAGVYLLRSHLLEQFPLKRPLSFEEDVFPALLSHHAQIKVHVVTAPFLDIGTPDSLPLAEAFIQSITSSSFLSL